MIGKRKRKREETAKSENVRQAGCLTMLLESGAWSETGADRVRFWEQVPDPGAC
jgi:hypothetical protein